MRILRHILGVVASVGLLALLVFGSLCLEIDRHGRKDLSQWADAIVVLRAGVLPDGEPGPDLSIRTQHAVSLYQAGLASRLICTGGIQGEPSSAAAVSRALAISLGVPEEAVFVADGSADAQEDAQRVALDMAQHGWLSAILVSHPLHVYRAKLEFEREGLTVRTSPRTTDADGIDLPWRTNGRSRKLRASYGLVWRKPTFPPPGRQPCGSGFMRVREHARETSGKRMVEIHRAPIRNERRGYLMPQGGCCR